MANISNLSSFLTDVADAIREKKGTQNQIPAENFDTEIKSIETGTKINNQDKDITKNGTYTADEGYTGLGTVIVNVPIKLFKTKEEMNNSTGNAEGDLAIVYIKGWQNVLDGIYIYKNNNWELAPTQLTATPNYVYKQSFYGKNGIENGTLGTPNNLFDDTNAEVYNKIQNQYENMEPKILTDNDRTISANIYFIPVKRDGTPLLNTSKVTNMSKMFYYCRNLTTIPLLDTSNVTDMDGMFWECTRLTTIPLLDTSNVTDMQYMFYECTYLTTIPELNTSKVTNMGNMFDHCSNLTTIPLLDTSNVVKMYCMFYYCTNLTTIPELNTSKVTNMGSMFYYCRNLTTIPLLDTSNVTDMNRMFVYCKNLTTIPLLDTSKVTNMGNMFSDCTHLSDDSLNTIMQMCINATSYTDTKTLKYIGLTSEQANKCKTLSNYSAFTSAGWTTGY